MEARRFYEAQWAYILLRLKFQKNLYRERERVIPIHQRQRVNSKGGISSVWEIVVLEDFVDPRLRERASSARFMNASDNLGYLSPVFMAPSCFLPNV
ncbi:uncharacterized protein PV07_08053 [Cladophialophora immunda]|uniref:Uncharacterized protein n=1 Tax=Cladophialophora immunda TaxID=569365 RepID=A0A0D2CDP0_9EURO|nr:uncharacterized protein PV07_08053 [Cladophialophora immunda]KIW28385.1 hypothetical protein PV07_08053 [Cladophialophora immunda]